MKAVNFISLFSTMLVGVYSDLDWWKTMSLYQIYPRSFQDSDGDGIGDLRGIQSRLQYIKDSGFDAFWLSPILKSPMIDFGYDISDYRDIDPIFGTIQDFDNLIEAAHNISIKVILDFVPNHVSEQHIWFQKALKGIEPYVDYFTWNEGKIVNGTRQPPNNWLEAYLGTAWTWSEERQAYYLHEFAVQQPDLNYRNPNVRREMKNVLRFWLDRGVDGFRMDAVPYLIEDSSLRDEPASGLDFPQDNANSLKHIRTKSQPETYYVIREFREVLDEYIPSGNYPVMMGEAYAVLPFTLKFYKFGLDFPFNFGFLEMVNDSSSAADFKFIIDRWMDNMPAGATPNWVAGNHDNPRLFSRLGQDLAKAVTSIVQLLPGVAVTYYGDEIGMENYLLSWEDTIDPQGCNAGIENYAKLTRDPERTPFQWDNDTSSGFSTNPKTWLPVNPNYETLNLQSQRSDPNSNYNFFLKVTSLRKLPSVKYGSLFSQVIDDDVLLISRSKQDERSLYLLVNFSNDSKIINFEAFESRRLYLTIATRLMDISEGDIVKDLGNVTIPGRGTAIFLSP